MCYFVSDVAKLFRTFSGVVEQCNSPVRTSYIPIESTWNGKQIKMLTYLNVMQKRKREKKFLCIPLYCLRFTACDMLSRADKIFVQSSKIDD